MSDGDERVINIIEARGIHTAFGKQVVHDQLDLTVKRGEVLGIVGASGTGKSVLLRSIIGLIEPQRGSIRVFGKDTKTLARTELSSLKQRWGVLFQAGALFSSLTVAQNIQVPMREHLALPQALMDELAALKLAMVGLPANAGPKYPSELSGGMRKRAGLARALALDPELLFLDEPTSGLDPIGANEFDELIKTLQQNLSLTVFMVTHDLDSLHAICDRVAVLADQRVMVTGNMDDMMQQEHPWVRQYFRGPRGRAVMPMEMAHGDGNGLMEIF